MSLEENAVLLEYQKRLQTPKVNPSSLLFDKQKEVFFDKARFIACLCTRRAGKSVFGATRAIHAAQQHANSMVPYIALTRESGRNIVWPVLIEMANKLGIGYKANEGSLRFKLTSNGSEIKIFGADQKNFIDRLRGPKYPLAIIDEAQAFKNHLNELVDDVLTPACLDYMGQIILLGTPGVKLSGLFYETTKTKGSWSLHKWSVYDNPYMPHAKREVENLFKIKGWTRENPTYRREWLGEWVEDTNALVYKFQEPRNIYFDLPKEKEWYRILGVDYGFKDKTTFSIVAYNKYSPKVFVEYCEGFSELIPSVIATKLKRLIDKYSPFKIVADTGGLGKSITEEMKRRYGIPIEPAKKTEKMAFISLMNGDFIDGRLLVHNSLEDLKHEYLTLIKDEKDEEDKTLPNDYCDATLYAWREARAYGYEGRVHMTPELELKQQEDKHLQDALDQFNKEESGEWWERA